MKLLIVTQAVDLDNPILGFFHAWIEELAGRFESIVVICLFEGRHSLPANVEVFSLGKSAQGRPSSGWGKSWLRIQYALRFLHFTWGLRGHYDSVFVHMNQEYVLVAGWLWMLLRKRVYLWRNHYQPNALTGFVAFFCTKMFCTSKYSYIATYAKTVLMPIGIDTETFKPIHGALRKKSVLFLGRIAPSKHVEVLIEALGILMKKGVSIGADMYGSATSEDTEYREGLIARAKELGLKSTVRFHAEVSNARTPDIYRTHEIFVNCSASGMYDKTIFEALACGTRAIASSRDYAKVAPPELVFKENDARDLSMKIEKLLSCSAGEGERIQKAIRTMVEKNSLHTLGQRLAVEVKIVS